MEENLNYSSFQGLRPHFDALARVGYFRIVLKELSPTKLLAHNVYRCIVTGLVLMYNLQHIVRAIQARHSTDQMVDTLFILLTILNTLGKQAALNLRSRRIHDIIAVINGPLFAPSKLYHVEVLKENALAMSRLLKLYHAAVLICACLWTAFPIVNRALEQEVQFTGYYPFDTTKLLGFSVALTYMFVVLTYQAYANVTMDNTIVAFYAMARTQIKILRYDLEHLASNKEGTDMQPRRNAHTYKDYESGVIQQRLKKCVVQYEQIRRFTKEVESIFGEAMVVQLFVMAWVICMTMYKIVGLSILSAEFVSMAVYLCCMLGQLFIYCYYGTQLKIESEFVNQSVYCCEWLRLSPRFRRQLLVLMEGCSRPVEPRTAYVIPMSLETYISVLKLSYTLFTFLNRK